MTFIDIILPTLPICGLLLVILAIGIGFSYLMLKFTYRNIRACPECGTKSAGEIVDVEEIPISNNVDHKRRKPVRIKVVKLIDHYQCEACQHTWTRSFNRTERIPLDKENRV